MNDLSEIYYCNVGNVCYDTYGKIYEIKSGGNWKHINVNGKKIGVSTLPIKMKIFNFDDFTFLYWSYLFQSFPCPAMGYYVYLKMSGRSISLKKYFNEFGKNEKPQ